MKCYGIVPGAAAAEFQSAAWLSLTSNAVLLMQDTDYSAFAKAVSACGGTTLPMIYDTTPLSSDVVSSLAPISLSPGANLLDLVAVAGALNPSLGL